MQVWWTSLKLNQLCAHCTHAFTTTHCVCCHFRSGFLVHCSRNISRRNAFQWQCNLGKPPSVWEKPRHLDIAQMAFDPHPHLPSHVHPQSKVELWRFFFRDLNFSIRTPPRKKTGNVQIARLSLRMGHHLVQSSFQYKIWRKASFSSVPEAPLISATLELRFVIPCAELRCLLNISDDQRKKAGNDRT